MTLPKIFSLASKHFNNFDTMSFGASTTTNINSLSHHEQQHQTAQNSQEQILNSINPQHSTMSSLSLIPTSTHLETNNAMYDPNVNLNANVALSPQELISEKQDMQLFVECVMPGIYLTKDFISWKEEQLQSYGFTHIIIIDKHIQELYYPNQKPDIFKLCSMNNEKTKDIRPDARHDNSSSLNAFDYFYTPSSAANHLSFGKEFKVIDLNFGEKSYLTTVLPNCYRAVKFINKALQAGGSILVIDCNGGEQKCLTIIVAYLMYKHNISFGNAFARLKEFYKKADLDRFYISQLYEYEPILQVQRAQSRGHSCSRELHAAILKRKKTHDDDDATLDTNTTYLTTSATSSSSCYPNTSTYTNVTTTTELLDNCNPLNRFDSTQMDRHKIKPPNQHNHPMTQDNRIPHTFTRFMSGTTSSSTTTGGWYNWEDYAME